MLQCPTMGCANAVYTSWIVLDQGQEDSNCSWRKTEKLHGFESSQLQSNAGCSAQL
ncbi:hypothetical protein WH47_04576 [Habropoda laboriosa]|uniref:Uncharacterized protein n=1 Tax=Habropoda laboriosa TaxID=597456 RepID=A0A0L7R2I9_9HYME|nr:hypothetical protein WH47_04576 [Habropoda laboriosa]